MRIVAARDGGSANVQLAGRLDREWAEHLSGALEHLVRDGVRTLSLDFGGVTYISTAATDVLDRWHEELAILRGELRLLSLSPPVRECFDVAGWSGFDADASSRGQVSLRRSSWHTRASIDATGQYELSTGTPAATLACHLYGGPDPLAFPAHGVCPVATFPPDAFGLGVGAIGAHYNECRERMGEFLAVAGCLAYFPSDGARMPDFLVADGPQAPSAVLSSGIVCRGGWAQLVRFSTRPEAEAVRLSELAATGLEAAGGKMAGIVIVAETAGLAGARLRRSPRRDDTSLQFDVPAVREWLSFASERTCAMTTTLVVGVVARAPKGPLAAHLRPLEPTGRLCGHFHAAVFAYHPLPQRTVELGDLARALFANSPLRDVMHLVWDDRGEAAVGESAFLRGVSWVAPITQVAEPAP